MTLTAQQRAEMDKITGNQSGQVNDAAKSVATFNAAWSDYDAKNAKPQSFLKETWGDIKQTGSALKDTFLKTSEKLKGINEAEATGKQGATRSLLQGIGTVAGGVSGAIGDVLTGGVKAALPEKAETAVKEKVKGGIEKIAPLVTPIIEKYNSLDEKTKRDIDAVTGLGSFILDITGLGLGKKTAEVVAKKTAEVVGKGVVKGAEAVGRAGEKLIPMARSLGDIKAGVGRGLSNIPTKIGTNIAEKRAGLQAIEALPTEMAKKTASLGIDVADVNTLLRIPEVIKPEAKKLIQSVKDFASGISKVRPEEVVGKPITLALKNLEKVKTTVGKKLGDVAKNLGVVSREELLEPVFNKLKGVINGLTVKNGKLNFSNTVLSTVETKADRKAIQSIFEQATKWGTGEKKHKLRQELFEILGGKKKSLTNITATQEKAYEAIRQALSDVLDTKNPLYKSLNTEYAKIMSPLSELRKIMRATGADDDILDMSAGLLARRLTSNASSNPQLRQILRNIDEVLTSKGLATSNVEGLQDIFNILNKYYDISAPTGFQGQIKSAIPKSSGDLMSRAYDAATALTKETPAVRKKALEDFLDDLLGS
jgi:hypothetical protein